MSGEQPSTLTDQGYWDARWGQQPLRYNRAEVLFQDLFARYVQPGADCFEVGCFPGRYMIYLAQEYSCTVSGIDFTGNFDAMRDLLQREGVEPDRLYNADFLQFQAERAYSFVYSVGFIEHFVHFEDLIARHAALVREGGLLMLACPNFRGPVQYALHYLFDRRDLRKHYLPSMDLQAWQRALERSGMEVLHAGYYRTFRFWVAEDRRPPLMDKAAAFISRGAAWIDRRVNWPNRWTSPHMVCIAIKH